MFKNTKIAPPPYFLGMFLSLFICFLVNIFNRRQLWVIVFNSFLFLASWIFFIRENKNSSWREATKKREYLLALAFLGLIPFFSFNPQNGYVLVFFISALFILLLSQEISRLRGILLFMGFLFLLMVSLTVGEIINISWNGFLLPSISFNGERTIFFNEAIHRSINQHAEEFPSPYRVNFFFYTVLFYIFYVLGNLTRFFSLKNFFDALLLANFYPLVLGIYSYFSDFRQQNKLIAIWILVTFFSITINKSQDAVSSLYSASPWLLFLILLGIRKVKMRVYFFLLFLSILLFFIPKI